MKQMDLFNENPSKAPEIIKISEDAEVRPTEINTDEETINEINISTPEIIFKRKRKKKRTIEEQEYDQDKKNTVSKRGRKSYKETDLEIALVDVPDDEILFKKQYYSIGEVAVWFNVNHSLIRYWENEFDILKPRKNGKGDRLFRPEDVKNLQLIYYLLRNCKYSVEGAKQYLKDNKKKADLDMRLISSLTKFRSFLLELQANLQA